MRLPIAIALTTLAITLATALAPALGLSMPSAADISNVESLVNELLPANAKPAERAAAAENLAPQAETEAAKFLLLRIAFQSYVKGGEYEKAEGAFDSLLSQVPDYPVDDQDELFAKALYPLSNKTGPYSFFPLVRVSQK